MGISSFTKNESEPKIAAAITALGSGGRVIDATHFSGTQSCTSNPFSMVPTFSASYELQITLGPVLIKTTVPWSFETSMVSIDGAGPQLTKVEYTGGSAIAAILTIGQFATLVPQSMKVDAIGPHSAFLRLVH